MMKKIIILVSLLIQGCVSYESSNTDYQTNACLMLTQNYDWFTHLQRSKDKWGIPISIQLAFIKQESNFKHDARPYINKNGRRKLASSALGYSQALSGTWMDYKNNTKRNNALRTNFGDSIDFIGWYNRKSLNELKLKKHDAYNLYLAYHEGHSGFRNRSYQNKKWLKRVAKKVEGQALRYSKQLNYCQTIGYY